MASLRRFCSRAVAIAALCLPAICPAQASRTYPAWSTSCLSIYGVHDGDTLTCESENRGTFIVRFAGIDAPETSQAFWRVARDRLKELAKPGTVAECYKTDQYGRNVCRLFSADGMDLADSMIGSGLAWHAVDFSSEQTPDERARYAKLELSAKTSGLGLWADESPMQPRECRRLKAIRMKCR